MQVGQGCAAHSLAGACAPLASSGSWAARRPRGCRAFPQLTPGRFLSGDAAHSPVQDAECLRRATWLARRFPSWQEHGGVAIATVGFFNGLLVIAGFAITWLSTLKRYQLDCKTHRLQRELQRTEQQLETLFGPLKAITHATQAGYSSFMVEHSKTLHYKKGQLIPDVVEDMEVEKIISRRSGSLECKRYQQLIRCILQPLNHRAMETVLNHTHLIDGEFPECLYLLYAHVIEMDSLLKRWESGDLSVMFPPTTYPAELNKWAGREFERLRLKQKSLMSELE